MDKREREKLEDVLNQIQNTQSGMLGGLYGDFFGNGSSGKSTGNRPNGAYGSSINTSSNNLSGNTISNTSNNISNNADPLLDAKNALNEFNTKVNEASANGVRPATKDKVSNSEEADTKNEEPKEPEEDPMETLDKLIGLDTIKSDVKELTNFVKIQKTRKDAGLKSVPVSLHLVFTGNPGTGKTTVARIISKLYKNIGVLSRGTLQSPWL